VRLRVTLPQGARGAYLVTVCVNARAQVRERSLRNNCRRAGQVTVPEPRAPLTPAPAPELPSPLVPGVPAPPPPVPDTTPPQTTINGAPAAIAGQSVATFWFSAGARSTFECRLDDGPWEFCSPPRQYTSLAAGPHRFEVRAVDTAGNVDPTPAEHAWTVDLTRPQTMIASGPSGLVASSEATFEVGSDDPAASFECRLDGGSWASCASPVALSGLADGAHTFDVRAIDLAANQDTTPASRTWTVDTTAPGTVISAGPSGEVPPGDVAFSFGSDDAGATFECRVDDAPFAPCVSPQPVLAPAPGPHTFEVRAVDPAGNADPSPAAGAWTTLAPG
jgi:hypothetical protein